MNQYNPATVFVSENRTSDITQSDGIEARLRKKLFGSGYDPELRPVMNQSDKVTVTLGVSLHQIIEVVSRSKYSLLCNVIVTWPTVFSRYAAMRMTKDWSFYPLRFFHCSPWLCLDWRTLLSFVMRLNRYESLYSVPPALLASLVVLILVAGDKRSPQF